MLAMHFPRMPEAFSRDAPIYPSDTGLVFEHLAYIGAADWIAGGILGNRA
jgi:hypothetical protein